MVASHAVFGAETSGHVYFKVSDTYYTESAAYALAVLLRLLASRPQPLSELVEPLRSATRSRPRSTWRWPTRTRRWRRSRSATPPGRIDKLDGVSVELRRLLVQRAAQQHRASPAPAAGGEDGRHRHREERGDTEGARRLGPQPGGDRRCPRGSARIEAPPRFRYDFANGRDHVIDKLERSTQTLRGAAGAHLGPRGDPRPEPLPRAAPGARRPSPTSWRSSAATTPSSAEIASNTELAESAEDKELQEMAREELAALEMRKAASMEKLKVLLVPRIPWTTRTSSWRSGPGPGATRRRCSPPTCSACTPTTPTRRSGRSRSCPSSPTGIGGFKEIISSITRQGRVRAAALRERRAPRAARARDRGGRAGSTPPPPPWPCSPRSRRRRSRSTRTISAST